MVFSGFAWKVGFCPICHQPLGWIWQEEVDAKQSFYGIRLDKVMDWSDFIFGPFMQVPSMIFG